MPPWSGKLNHGDRGVKPVIRPHGVTTRACLTAAAAVLVTVAAGLGRAALWQDDGHVMVNRVAAMHLPSDVPEFFRDAVERLAYLGPEPDRWREDSEFTLKASQEPDHFIHLEEFPQDFAFPRSRYDFYQHLYARRGALLAAGAEADHLLPETVGLLPYITIEIYERLKVAFRQYRALRAEGRPTDLVEGNAILYAGWLGHYVADGANPHHASVHFDGWVGENQASYRTTPGIHGLFEGDFVREAISESDFSDGVGPARRIEDPFAAFLAYLRGSGALVEELYRIEKAGGFDGAGTPEGLGFTIPRLALASEMLRDLWYTAWMASAEEPG